MKTVLFVFLASCIGYGSCNDCDFYSVAQPGVTYAAYYPPKPNPHSGSLSCNWVLDCPGGQCSACCVLSMPSCSKDYLLISQSGDVYYKDAYRYCGNSRFTIDSFGERLALQLNTVVRSSGGSFFCNLTSTAPPPPTCSCGWKKQNRIVGGQETEPNEYPMMAGIVENNYIVGGAVIISDRHVLTAAQCVAYKDVSDIYVLVGDHDITKTTDSEATLMYPIIKVTVHYYYEYYPDQYNVAVVTVSVPFTISDRVGPVCLPFGQEDADLHGTIVTALGWGNRRYGGVPSSVLREVDLVVDDTCPGRDVTDNNLCTYTRGKETCQRDEGGPILKIDGQTGRLVLVGVIGSSEDCGTGLPGLHTRVTQILDWITDNTPGVEYCVI